MSLPEKAKQCGRNGFLLTEGQTPDIQHGTTAPSQAVIFHLPKWEEADDLALG